jgi:hypothetical protein
VASARALHPNAVTIAAAAAVMRLFTAGVGIGKSIAQNGAHDAQNAA